MNTTTKKYTVPFAEYPNELVREIAEKVGLQDDMVLGRDEITFMKALGFKGAEEGIRFFSRFGPSSSADSFAGYMVGLETGLRLAEAVWRKGVGDAN